jgi:vacuolar-type H+-ATPase subunit E/Vma4
MSLEKIISRIKGEAGQRSEAIRDAAEKNKNAILKDHAEELEVRHKRDIEKAENRIIEDRKKKEFHARREASRTVMNARRAMMDAAIEKAVSNLAESGDTEYLGMIKCLLNSCDLKGKVNVIISPSDEDRITPSYLREHSSPEREFMLSEERHSEKGGIILNTGKISQNGTFPMLAKLAHEELIMVLSELLPLEKI